MQNHFIQLNVIAGLVLLVSGIPPLWRIYRMLPGGFMRSIWFLLGFLISVGVCGYLTFFFLTLHELPNHYEDLFISSIFLIGAVFTAVICRMSHSTAKDVSRIALLEYHARVDSLTGLFNRRYTMSFLQNACGSSYPKLSILLLDIDYFKQINDTFGHQTGDKVLQRFADLLTGLHSEPAFIGRYGGDEFVIVLPQTDMTEACLVAARICHAAETIDLSEQSHPITVSIGVASSGLHGREAEDLLAQADEALYSAKRGGRNQVVGSRRAGSRRTVVYSSAAANAASRTSFQLAD
jgi:diguanylate cyclase (GGDEF)-like protein